MLLVAVLLLVHKSPALGGLSLLAAQFLPRWWGGQPSEQHGSGMQEAAAGKV